MNKFSVNFLLLIAVSLIIIYTAYSEFKCVECHSKRPGALAMHKALVGQDCFECHIRGEKLRQKGGIPEEKHQAFLKQRLEDDRCIQCHVTVKSFPAVPESEKKQPAMLSGRSYCPKCQIVGEGDWKMCPKCGGNLLHMDSLIRESALNPNQALCRKCHHMEDALKSNHIELLGTDFSETNDCLDCHQAHTECSGCHQ